MGLLDLLKRNTEDEGDEDQEESREEGLGGGLLSRIRGMGDSAGEVLGRVLKKNADDIEDDEDDETVSNPTLPGGAREEDSVAAAPATASTSEAAGPASPPSPEPSVAGLAGIDLTGEGPTQTSKEGSGEKPGGAPDRVDLSLNQEASDQGDSLGLGDLFAKKPEIDQNLRDLAESQESVSVQELAEELRAFLARLEGRTPEEGI
jgi:hypothetical protein